MSEQGITVTYIPPEMTTEERVLRNDEMVASYWRDFERMLNDLLNYDAIKLSCGALRIDWKKVRRTKALQLTCVPHEIKHKS
jgi:hypothetical protein